MLYVTVKTVDNHLGRVYIKFGTSSRGQIAGRRCPPVTDNTAASRLLLLGSNHPTSGGP